VNTVFALASVLGLILAPEGPLEISRAVPSRGSDPHWWAGLVTGVLLVLLAFWVSSSDREFALGAAPFSSCGRSASWPSSAEPPC
jgi:uncharacterized membrane protein HdeD (DUF308 family)